MAGNNAIQFLRGTATQRRASSESLLPGQPFFETDTRKLYIGGASGTQLNSASPVNPDPSYPVTSVNGKTGAVITPTFDVRSYQSISNGGSQHRQNTLNLPAMGHKMIYHFSVRFLDSPTVSDHKLNLYFYKEGTPTPVTALKTLDIGAKEATFTLVISRSSSGINAAYNLISGTSASEMNQFNSVILPDYLYIYTNSADYIVSIAVVELEF